MTAGVRTGRVRSSASQLLQAGLSVHRLGRLEEADRLYHESLAVEPRNPDAHQLLGLLALAQDQWVGARGHFARAVELVPKSAAYRSNYGHALRLLGELGRAESELRQAVAIDPSFGDGWVNLGLVLLDGDRIDEAIVALQSSVRCAPESALGHLNLGAALLRAGCFAEARTHCEKAIELAPHVVVAHRNLGIAAHQQGDLDGAKAAYRRALELGLPDPDVLTNLGVVLLRQGEIDPAIEVHERAVAAGPDLAATWLNRGTALQAAGRLAEAGASFERAVAINPEGPPLTALGSLMAEQGDFPGAIRAHERAIAWDPDFADGHWNLALALLGGGDLGRGWEEYEWRWRASSCRTTGPGYPWPQWPGPSAREGRLLVWKEQGLGDELLFLSCLPDLAGLGLAVTLLVSPRLVSLVGRSLPSVKVVPDLANTGGFDWHLPLGSLPGHLRPTVAAFDGSGQFLVPAAARADEWRRRLDRLPPGKRVGICWRTGLLTAERQRHYPSLIDCEALWRVPGVVWVNLQYDECDAELGEVAARWGVVIHRWPGDDLRDDLEGVAALIAQLDGVVTAPTAVSSLAGAVGTPTWLIDSGSDWSSFGEDRSPWFPSIQVFRKGAGEAAFGPVVERVASDLARWTAGGQG